MQFIKAEVIKKSLYHIANQKSSIFSNTFLNPVIKPAYLIHEEAAVRCFGVDGIDGIFL